MSHKHKARKTSKKVHTRNLGIHNGIVKSLEQRLLDSPIQWEVQTNIEYGNSKRVVGEIDVYAEACINDKWYMLDIEVKSSDKQKTRHKAYQQLKRAYKRFSNNYDKCIMMYAYKLNQKIYVERVYIR